MRNILFSVARVLDTTVVAPSVTGLVPAAFVITGRGGQAPYFWTILSTTGVSSVSQTLDGPSLIVDYTPTAAGIVTFTVRITDARRVSKTRVVSVSVVDPFTGFVLGTEDGEILGADDPFIEDLVLGFDGAVQPPTP